MGLEDVIEATDDIGAADAILASGSELRGNPWIRAVAKFHHLPVFVLKVSSNYQFHHSFNVVSLCLILKFAPCSQIPWHKWSRQYE